MRIRGMCRTIGRQGRFTIPKEIRDYLSLKEGDLLEIFPTEGGFIVRTYQEVPPTLPTRIEKANGLETDLAKWVKGAAEL